ncbi:UDP-2,4-diacetamido-2,4,6-trideoxy-beta-L-altropyranose hydrolase [Nostocoides sp. F2B08]|uniref:UDP-2,4-diacetamido-2,4, 6-trideoxy-beta-L-altropyranose hydrolase n=1 Tax=Nostocoides sp. F2B08 TaxID=2653936 RepID=UPI00186B48F7|nr:UDP-2,4-diacetamido-2,4,6-trideoxy-beta-L-altropyranose hydrolase [Tetrasphaera sp. F2B08]
MAEPRVLVRVDAGMGIGHGHLVRSLAVVRTLTSRGVHVTVATRAQGGHVEAMITAAGAHQVALPAGDAGENAIGRVWPAERQEADVRLVFDLVGRGWDAVVVDHYRLDAAWESVAAERGGRLVVIDDLANRAHRADVLVDHNWYGSHTSQRYRELVDPSTDLLLGPRYALLQSDYLCGREHGPVVHPPRRVVVSYGGTDAGGQSARAVDALDVMQGAEVDVVVGSAAAVTEDLVAATARRGARLHVELPSLAPLYARADLALGASGTATWERLRLGVPALVTTVGEGQSGVTRALHEAGLTRWIGTAADATVDIYRSALRDYLDDGPMDIPALVDGYGAVRVGFAVVPPHSGELSMRDALPQDAAAFVTAGGAGIGDDEGVTAWRRRDEWFGTQASGAVQIVELAGVPVGVVGGPGGSGRVLDSYVS